MTCKTKLFDQHFSYLSRIQPLYDVTISSRDTARLNLAVHHVPESP